MGETGSGEFDPRNFLASFRLVAVGVLMAPRAFFAEMQRSGGFGPPAIFLLACLAIHTLILGLLYKNAVLMGRHLLLGMVFPMITAGLLHFLLTRCFKARGTFEAAFRVNAYAAAVNLLSWFPVVGVLLEFYRLYVVTVGLSAVFTVETWKALVAVVLIVALYAALASGLTHLTGSAPGSVVMPPGGAV